MKKIAVSIDTFASIWAARQAHETTEDEIIARWIRELGLAPSEETPLLMKSEMAASTTTLDRPKSTEWVDVLVWALQKLGGRAPLAHIYAKCKVGRELMGKKITPNHDAAARERLESYCSESRNYKGIADLFFMPEGKGAGIWALRENYPERYR